MTQYDFHSELGSIRCPTLLLYGQLDPLTELAGKKLHQSIDNTELIIFEESGHFPFIEKQDDFNQNVIKFLEHREKCMTLIDRYRNNFDIFHGAQLSDIRAHFFQTYANASSRVKLNMENDKIEPTPMALLAKR